MKAISIVDVLRDVNRDYKQKTITISTPNNDAFDALLKDSDAIIQDFQMQQIEAYKEAGNTVFY